MLNSLWQNQLVIDHCAMCYKGEAPCVSRMSGKARRTLKDILKCEQTLVQWSEVGEVGVGKRRGVMQREQTMGRKEVHM